MASQYFKQEILLHRLQTFCKDESAIEQLKTLLGNPSAPNKEQPNEIADDLHQTAIDVITSTDVVMITEASQHQKANALIMYVNPAFTRITGYLPEDVIGKSPKILQGPKTDRKTLNKLRKAIEAGQPIKVEVLNYRKDGMEFWGELSMAPITNESGVHKYWASVKRDITERKKVEDVLLESEKRLGALISDSKVLIWESDSRKTIAYCNKSWLEFTGQRLEQSIGHGWDETLHPEDVTRFGVTYTKAFNEQQPFDIEIRMRRHDGVYRWFMSSGFPKFTPDGVFTGHLITSIDITSRKTAEDQQHFQAMVINQIHEAVFSFDPDEKITFWNSSAEFLYGYSSAEVVGKTLAEVIKIKFYQPEDEQNCKDHFQTGKSFVIELIHRNRNGKEIPVSVSGTVTLDRLGNRTGWVEVVRDMTEAKRGEEEKEQLAQRLLQAQKMESIGTLASGISHDFNNILTSIAGYASLLRPLVENDPTNAKRLFRIEEAAQRAAALTQQILGFARQGKLNVQPVLLSDCIGSVIRLIEPTLDKRIQIISELQPGQPLIEGDKGQLEQVILNLAVNAIDAMMENLDQRGYGELRFKVQVGKLPESNKLVYKGNSDCPFVHFMISHSGTGISEDILPKIYDPFFTTKAVGKGTGLGLSMVYGIVENHHGLVSVESEIGKGTSFHLYFPSILVSSEKQPEMPGTSSWQTSLGSGTVLVIDDDLAISEMVSEVLKIAGYNVLTAEDGTQGVKRYAEHSHEIDLVLLDMNMPKMNGRETFHQLKKICPEVKVVLATGYSENQVAGDMLNQGLSGIISKPYRIEDLVQKVSDLLVSRN